MKKLILLLVPFMILLISFNSMCASQEDITTLKNKVNSTINITLSDSFAAQIIDKWQTSGYINCWVNKDTHGQVQVTLANTYNMQGGNYHPTSNYINTGWISPSTTSTITWNNQTPGSYISGVSGYSCYVGKWEDFHTIPIDWENPFYSPNIPAPVFDVYNAELNSVPIVDVPLSFDFQFVPSTAYVEIWADYSIPTKINVLPYPPNSAQYRVLDYNVESVNVLDKELLYQTEALNSSYVHVILREGWRSVLDEYPINNIEFTTQGATSGWLDNKIADYEDLRKTNTLYGSAIKIKMRYFTIVNDTQFVVGPWRIWDSKNPETFTNELPESYQVYLPASGNTGTSVDTSPTADIPSGSGTPTGTYYDPNVNITVTQNVPNYPDYPTIATYNKDHLLVDAMNGVKSLNGFFGEMVEFLTVSFAFIPGYIWTIIAVGFSLSIIVMFLKIL